MSTAQAMKLQNSEVIVRDRTRVFGYTGGAPGLLMDAKKSSLDCNPIEGGRLLLFSPGKDGYLGGLDVKGKFKQAYVDIMPTDYANLVDRRFHLTDDMGFRMLPMLTKLPYKVWTETVDGKNVPRYEDEANKYFDVVHPELAPCPFGLNTKLAHHNPEVGTGKLIFTHCPTCRLADLKSDACSERIYQASETLDSAILLELRRVLIEANEATITHITSKSTMVQADIARTIAGGTGFRTGMNAVDRIHLRQLHKEENQQSNTQLDAMKTLAQEMAAAMKSVQAPAVVEAPVQEGVTLTPDEAAEFAAYKAKKELMAKARAAKGGKDESSTNSE